MKIDKKAIVLAIVTGLSIWVADAVIDRYFFSSGSFVDLVIRNISKHELYMRLVILISFAVFGFFIGYYIAKEKKLQKEYQDAEQKSRVIFDTINDPIFLHPLRAEGFAPFVDVNATACRRYGYTRDEFLRLNATDITLTSDVTAHASKDHRQKLRNAGQLIFEAIHITKSGRTFPVEINSSVVELSGRKMILAVVRDISQRKQMESEQLAMERQIQHAQKLESLGILAGGIAHDFNNLLMTILGNADLALDEISPLSPACGKLQEIEKTAKRAADLSKQMLAYSGKGHFVIEPVNFNELITEMAHMLKVSISKKAVLKFNFADNLPMVDGDATQMRQIMMNLITNASDALGDRTGVLAISTGVIDCSRTYLNTTTLASLPGLSRPLPEGVYVYVKVMDTGCGMDPDIQKKIFDPFFTTKFTGRGLGMAAVQGIVRGHKGTIKVYSEVGKGTTFKVLFPISVLLNTRSLPERVDQPEEGWQGSGTILVADDEAGICTVARQMLEKKGFKVLTAADGHQALEVFKVHTDEINCVLLDLTMPKLNGNEVFREMRLVRSDIKVIITSGYNESDATQYFIGKGLAGFIQKPFTTASLLQKVREVLSADN